MTVDEILARIQANSQRNQWRRWQIEARQRARRSRQLPKGMLNPFAVPESAPEEEIEVKGDYERPDFSIPELDAVLADSEKEAEALMRLYRL